MIRTAVPEAPINEHCDLLPRERNVDGAAAQTRDGQSHPVPPAPRMQRAPDLGLRFGVNAPLLPHPAPHSLAGRRKLRWIGHRASLPP